MAEARRSPPSSSSASSRAAVLSLSSALPTPRSPHIRPAPGVAAASSWRSPREKPSRPRQRRERNPASPARKPSPRKRGGEGRGSGILGRKARKRIRCTGLGRRNGGVAPKEREERGDEVVTDFHKAQPRGLTGAFARAGVTLGLDGVVDFTEDAISLLESDDDKGNESDVEVEVLSIPKMASAMGPSGRAAATATAAARAVNSSNEATEAAKIATMTTVRRRRERLPEPVGDGGDDGVEILDENIHRPTGRKRRLNSGVDVIEILSPSPQRPTKLRQYEDLELISMPKEKKLKTKGTPLSQITDIFPDVDHDHVVQLLKSEGMKEDSPQLAVGVNKLADLQVQSVLSRLLDGSYPKRKDRNNSLVNDDEGLVHLEGAKRPYLHDYESLSSFEPSENYRIQCHSSLLKIFPFLKRRAVNMLLSSSDVKGHFFPAHKKICAALLGFNPKKSIPTPSAAGGSGSEGVEARRADRRYRRLRMLMSGIGSPTVEEASRLNACCSAVTVKPPPKGTVYKLGGHILDPVLQDEVRYAADFLSDREAGTKAHLDRLKARKVSQETGTTFECMCCFSDDLAFEEMVSCRNEGHLFCVDCLRKYAEERVFGVGSLQDGGNGKEGSDHSGASGVAELRCMHAGCSSGFPYGLLKKALPPKVVTKYDELQARAAVEVAGVEGLCQCPKCGFQAMLDPAERIFSCPIADCRYQSCRECGEPPHIPLKCSEVEKKRDTDGRTVVEEAMTEARIRTCPKPRCTKRFYKIDGCNKITCPPPCGALVCYVCRSEIEKKVGYAHFCQTPHCRHEKCGKCPLYSNAAEDDLRAAKEAGMKAADEVRKKSLEDINENTASLLNMPSKQRERGELRVDVEALLKDPSNITKKRSGRK